MWYNMTYLTNVFDIYGEMRKMFTSPYYSTSGIFEHLWKKACEERMRTQSGSRLDRVHHLAKNYTSQN